MGDWLMQPLIKIALFIDSIVYSLVAYSYRIFMIVCRINLNSLASLIGPLVSRLKALIVVFILFKLVVSFLGYLVEPDSFTSGSKKLVKNIVIAVVLLISYTFIFDLGNDISMLLIGSNGDGSEYRVIDAPDVKEGLVARLIFGKNSQLDTVQDFGKYLSAITLRTFLYDTNGTQADIIYNKVTSSDSKSDFDFMDITTLSSDVGRNVNYHFPVLSTVIGLYLVYTILMTAIQTGVRVFKIMVLQIIAPIPICSIISGGTKSQSFQKFISEYTSCVLEIALRIGSMYLITGLIGTLWQQINSTSGSLFGGSLSGESGFTRGIIFLIMIVAGYKFVQELPNILSKFFPGLGSSKNNFVGDMKSILGRTGALAGTAAGTIGGALGGAIGGAVAGSAYGAGGAIGGMLRGGFNGGAGALNNHGHANIRDAIAQAQEQQNRTRDAGGMFRQIGGNIASDLGFTQHNVTAERTAASNEEKEIKRLNEANAEAQKRINEAQNRIDAAQNKVNSLNNIRNQAKNNVANSGITVGGKNFNDVHSANELFEKMKSRDTDLLKFKSLMENSADNGARDHWAQMYQNRMDDLANAAKTQYDAAVNTAINSIDSSISDINALDSLISGHNSTISSNESSIVSIQGTINANNASIASHQSSLDAHNKNIENYNNRL